MQVSHPLAGWIERATARRALGPPWPQALDRSQVFILPAGFGLLCAAAVVLLLMVALNYQNSPVFLLTFLLGALLCAAMVVCHRNLHGLEIRSVSVAPVFAGEPLHLRVSLRSHRRARCGLVCFAGRSESGGTSLAPGESAQLELALPARTRGRHTIRTPGLASREPFGAFRAWSRLAPVDCVVYPRPAAYAGMPPGTGDGANHGDANAEPEDFAGLAPYRPGDRPGQIAWRTYARSGILERKHFASGGRGTRWLDFEAAPGADHETRLSVLARWALDAEQTGAAWGLRLPRHRIEPDRGSAHLARCLRALALFPGPYDEPQA